MAIQDSTSAWDIPLWWWGGRLISDVRPPRPCISMSWIEFDPRISLKLIPVSYSLLISHSYPIHIPFISHVSKSSATFADIAGGWSQYRSPRWTGRQWEDVRWWPTLERPGWPGRESGGKLFERGGRNLSCFAQNMGKTWSSGGFMEIEWTNEWDWGYYWNLGSVTLQWLARKSTENFHPAMLDCRRVPKTRVAKVKLFKSRVTSGNLT